MARHWRLAVCRPSSVECRSCGPPRRFCVRRSRREEGAATTSMRPLLQHASRAHISNASAITSTVRPIGRFAAQSPLACITCQHRQASTVLGSIERPRTDSNGLSRWALRRFSSSPRWAEDKKPPSSSDPIAMPPPASKPASSVDRTPEQLLERQDRLRREWEEQQRRREEEALRKKQQEEEARRRREEEEALRKQREAEALQKKQQEEAAARKKQEQEQEQEQEALRKAQQPCQSKSAQPMPPPRPPPERAPSQPSATQEPTQSEPAISQTQEHVIDNVQRVPDEHLPSHQDRQRSNLEKRFTALMDELLPKIAVVTQKVNTFTGTDYSGVEALRREIKEQGTLLSKIPSSCNSNNMQRNLSKLAVLRLTPPKKLSMLLSSSRLPPRRRSLPSSSGNTPGPLVISSVTCP